jgi:asparagine synthase (glutamine-hydrolysing)
MCGICGIFDLKRKHDVQKERLVSMRDAMIHRGPDDAGIFVSQKHGIYLGHRRLKIIDLSANGRQPMSNEDHTIQIVFNGEIYNFQGLRGPLEKKGHRFKSNSDTEVLIHLYEEKGTGMLDDLEGMFAFAIWDEKNNILFLARDHLGIKPLYYSFYNGTLLFASEIKSLLAAGNLTDNTVNYNAVRAYFRYSYIPHPMTFYKNISKLEPGHFIIADRNGIKKRQYWDLVPGNILADEAEIIETHKKLVLETVKSHLISDAPLGAFLSGGVDSSIVVSVMSEISNARVRTFTIGFERASNTKDIELSRLISGYFGTSHHEYIMNPDISELFDEIVWYLDEPFSITSAIPIYLNSKFAKQNVDVVLTGDGADEVYAGYSRYLYDQILLIMRMIPASLKQTLLKSAVQLLAPFSPSSKIGKGRDLILKKMLEASEQKNPADAYLCLFSGTNPGNSPSFLSNDFFDKLDPHIDEQEYVSKYFGAKDSDHLSNLLYFDAKTSLVDEMLTKVDRMTMAHAIEARVPFLSRGLAEFVFSLNHSLKLRKGTGKYLLKKSFIDSLPKKVLETPKRGFNMPIDQWLRHELRDSMEHLLNPKKLDETGIFDSAQVNRMKATHLKNKENLGTELWRIMVLVKWLDLNSR